TRLRRTGGVDRQRHAEGRPLPLDRFDRDITAVGLRDMPHNRETQARPARRAASRLVDAVEALEDSFDVALGYPDSLVTHCELDATIVDVGAHFHHAAGLRVLDRVVEQIRDRAYDLPPITPDERLAGVV